MRRIFLVILVVVFFLSLGCGDDSGPGGGDSNPVEERDCFAELDHWEQNYLDDERKEADRLNDYGIEPDCRHEGFGRERTDCQQLESTSEYYGNHCVEGVAGGGCYWTVIADGSSGVCEYSVVCADEDQWDALNSDDDRSWENIWADGCVW